MTPRGMSCWPSHADNVTRSACQWASQLMSAWKKSSLAPVASRNAADQAASMSGHSAPSLVPTGSMSPNRASGKMERMIATRCATPLASSDIDNRQECGTSATCPNQSGSSIATKARTPPAAFIRPTERAVSPAYPSVPVPQDGPGGTSPTSHASMICRRARSANTRRSTSGGAKSTKDGPTLNTVTRRATVRHGASPANRSR